MTRSLLAALIVLTLAGSAIAGEPDWTTPERYAAYAGDVLLTRPLTLTATVVGAGIRLVTLPLHIASGDGSGIEALVTVPAAATFRRCWSCEIGDP